MKVRLLESAHDTWAPAGTVGELMMTQCGQDRFYPDSSKDHPLWIGRVKWEEVGEASDHVNGEVVMGGPVAQQKTRKRGK